MAIDVEGCYQRYGPMVLRRCRALLRQEEEAVDAMHDTFVQLLRRRGRLEDRGLSSLLYRVATNVCLNRLRSCSRRPEEAASELLTRIAQLDDPEPRLLDRFSLRALFVGEPSSTRTLAVLHLVDGLTLQEVATVVGLSVSGVRLRLRRLRARLDQLEENPS